MAVPDNMRDIIGEWTGRSRLWLSEHDPAQDSETTASISEAAGGRFLVLQYTWAYENKPQDGVMLIGMENDSSDASLVWIDSWHMDHKQMLCQGRWTGDAISAKGSYAAPPGPDWGWRIDVRPMGLDHFEMIMYNITPEGREELAVRAEYERRSDGR